ncbi:hypothetical protein GPALN_002186 [Globodera pallida]|nr:hypothetical protein GPALN_002186 [Globodera pallida]
MANMNFVPINAVFLLFVFIATLYVKPILAHRKCWQGIHGEVPEELAYRLLRDDSITVNADMVKVDCPAFDQWKNPCLTFTCTDALHTYIFNSCIDSHKLAVCVAMGLYYCDNGLDNVCYTCRNELCNNLSLLSDSQTSNQSIPTRSPDEIYVPIECTDPDCAGDGAAVLRVALTFLVATLIAGPDDIEQRRIDMETIFLQVLLLAMFATTAIALPSIKHKFLCDWDPINEVVDIRKCKPYAAQSPQEPQQPPQVMVVPSKPSEVTEVACRTERSESSEQCACFFQCSMIIVGILTVFALLALLIATYVAGCQMMMAIK